MILSTRLPAGLPRYWCGHTDAKAHGSPPPPPGLHAFVFNESLIREGRGRGGINPRSWENILRLWCVFMWTENASVWTGPELVACSRSCWEEREQLVLLFDLRQVWIEWHSKLVFRRYSISLYQKRNLHCRLNANNTSRLRLQWILHVISSVRHNQSQSADVNDSSRCWLLIGWFKFQYGRIDLEKG